MFEIIYNAFLIFYFLVFFEVLGFLIGERIFKKNLIFNIPIGFLTYMAIFEIFMLIPMVKNLSFDIVKYGMLPITIIFSFFILYKFGKKCYIEFKKNIKSTFVKVVYIIGFVFSVYVAIVSVSLGDGWLFSPMVMSSIQNNIIFSSNGIEIMGDIQSLHYTDGFYLFQSMLASISNGDSFVFVMTYIKFFEAFIIILVLAILSNEVFKKNRTVIFILQTLAIFLSVNLFTIYVNTNEINVHITQTISIGTSMLNNVILFFLFLFYYLRNKTTNSKLFLVIITISSFSFTASAMFVIVPYILLLSFIDVFYYKDTTKIKDYVFPIGIIFMYFGVYFILKDHSFFVFSIYCLIIALIFTISYKILSNMKPKAIFYVLSFIFVFVISFIFYGWLFLNNTFSILFDFINQNHVQGFDIYSHYYTNYVSSIFILAFSIFGLLKLYKYDRKIFVYVIFAFLIFSNIFAYRTFGLIINKFVYHRLSNLMMVNIVVLSGLLSVVEIFSNKISVKVNYIFAAIFILLSISFSPFIRYNDQEYSNFYEYKFVDKDLYMLYNHNFDKSNQLSIGKKAQPQPNLFQNIDQIFRVRADLNWITYCESNCYLLIDKNTEFPEGHTLELSTLKYNLFYKGEENE